MKKLSLEAKTSNEQIILEYLQKNASDALIDRINAGTKTLAQCWNYITLEAKKKAVNGCACVEDSTVFGWAIHFFEEENIKGEEYNNSKQSSKVVTPKETATSTSNPSKKKKTVTPKQQEQLTFEGLFVEGADESCED